MDDSPLGRVTWIDDFIVDNLSGNWIETVTTATMDLRQGHGGWWRMTLGSGEGESAALVSAESMIEIDEGEPVIFEARLRLSNAAKSSIFVGFTDVATDGFVMENEDSTFNTVASDAFGFLLEGEQDSAAWTVMGVEGDVDKAQAVLPANRIPVAKNDTTYTLRIEANSNGSGTVRAYVDGQFGTTVTNYFDSSRQWFFGISADGRGTAYNVDIDYIKVSMPRGDAPS